MCKDWFGYSAQHCQMTVPKIILALFGSLGEISGPEMSDIMIQLTVGNYILSQIEDNFCLECNHMHQPETCVVTADKWPVVIRKCIPYKSRLKRKWKGILAYTFTGLCLIEATVSPSLWMEKRSNWWFKALSASICHKLKPTSAESAPRTQRKRLSLLHDARWMLHRIGQHRGRRQTRFLLHCRSHNSESLGLLMFPTCAYNILNPCALSFWHHAPHFMMCEHTSLSRINP